MRDLAQTASETIAILSAKYPKICCLRDMVYLAWNLHFKLGEWGRIMSLDLRALAHKTWRTLASIQTGVVLLILVVILAAVGTVVLQRPATESDEMQSAYSPQRAEPLSHSRVHQVGPRQSNSNDRNTEINGAFSSSPPRSRQGAAASESERRCIDRKSTR